MEEVYVLLNILTFSFVEIEGETILRISLNKESLRILEGRLIV